jgi:hypothetical protein
MEEHYNKVEEVLYSVVEGVLYNAVEVHLVGNVEPARHNLADILEH